MLRFKLTPEAKNSLKQIARDTEVQWGKEKRNAYITTLDATFHMLSEHPHLGVNRDEIGYGVRSLPKGKHHIYYRVNDAHVLILNILHQHMDPNQHL